MVFGALAWTAAAVPVATAVGVDLSPVEVAVGLPLACVAALLPDIDHPDALLTRGWIPGTKYFGKLGRPLGIFISIPPRIIGHLARGVMGHRGGTHSIVFGLMWTFAALPLYALLIAALAWIISVIFSVTPLAFDPGAVWAWEQAHMPSIMPLVMIAVFLGYFSHLASDGLNTVPIGPIFWPFSKKRPFLWPKGLRIRVDSPVEHLLRSLLTIITVVLVIWVIIPPLYQQIRDGVSTGIEQIQKNDTVKSATSKANQAVDKVKSGG